MTTRILRGPGARPSGEGRGGERSGAPRPDAAGRAGQAGAEGESRPWSAALQGAGDAQRRAPGELIVPGARRRGADAPFLGNDLEARRSESGLIVVERSLPTSADAVAGPALSPGAVPSAAPGALWTPQGARVEPTERAVAAALERTVQASAGAPAAAPVHARWEEWKPQVDLSAYDGKVLLGFDAEVYPEGLAALIRRGYFDVQKFERRVRASVARTEAVLTKELLSGYIMQPGALEALPREVREALGVDELHLQGPTVALAGQSEQQSAAATRATRASGLSVPRGAEWQVLQQRWDALPLEAKRGVVPLTKLDALTLARMVGRVPLERNDSYEGVLDLSPTAPEWLRSAVLKLEKRPTESLDTVFEFALKGTSDKPNEFVANLMQLVQQTGTRTQVEQPLAHEGFNSSMHLHLSVPGKDLASTAWRWRRLLLVRSLAQGRSIQEGLLRPPHDKGNLTCIYDADLGRRNMVRMVSSDHVELRHRAASPEVELEEFLRHAFMPEDEALAAMDRETRALLDRHPKVLETIARVNPAVLMDFEPLIGAERVWELVKPQLAADLASASTPGEATRLWRFVERNPSVAHFERARALVKAEVARHGGPPVIGMRQFLVNTLTHEAARDGPWTSRPEAHLELRAALKAAIREYRAPSGTGPLDGLLVGTQASQREHSWDLHGPGNERALVRVGSLALDWTASLDSSRARDDPRTAEGREALVSLIDWNAHVGVPTEILRRNPYESLAASLGRAGDRVPQGLLAEATLYMEQVIPGSANARPDDKALLAAMRRLEADGETPLLRHLAAEFVARYFPGE